MCVQQQQLAMATIKREARPNGSERVVGKPALVGESRVAHLM